MTKEEPSKADILSVRSSLDMLNDTLLSLRAMKVNHVELSKSCLQQRNSLLDENFTVLKLDDLLNRMHRETKKDGILKEMYSLTYNDKPLSEFIEISNEEKSLSIKEKSDANIILLMIKAVSKREFLNERIFINDSDYCRNLFTLYERFFVSLAKLTMKKFREEFLSKEQIDFALLKKVSFNEELIVDELIKARTYGLTRGGGSELIKVCETLNLDFNEFKNLRENFTEIFYRRHILTHGTMMLSEDYKKHVHANLQKRFTKNDRLDFSQEYFKFLYETIVMVLFQLFIKSLYRKDITDDEIHLIHNTVFRIFFSQNEWEISKLIYNFLRKLKISQDSEYPEMLTVNYLICLKRLNEKEEFNKQMKLFNVGSLKPKFKVAKLLLEEKFDKVNNLLLEWCQDEGLEANEILSWPVFSDYIKTEAFEEFKKTNKEMFEIRTVGKSKEDFE